MQNAVKIPSEVDFMDLQEKLNNMRCSSSTVYDADGLYVQFEQGPGLQNKLVDLENWTTEYVKRFYDED